MYQNSNLAMATEILDILPNPVLVKNNELEYVWINKAFEALFDVRRADVIGKLDRELFPDRQVAQCNGGDLRVLETGAIDEAVETVFDPAGEPVETITRKSRLGFAEGEFYLVGVMHDITEVTLANQALKDSELRLQNQAAKLEVLASTDTLTGCSNRRALDDCQADIFSRDDRAAAVLLLDIDKFKSINDNHGHEFGDAVLCHFANVVRSVVSGDDPFVRLGGEEFVVVLSNVSCEEAELKANELRQLVAKSPVLYAGESCEFTVSIGLAFKAEGETMDLNEALRVADYNLYHAKLTGRNKVVLAV